MPKQYLGDAVYVDDDGFGVVLTTEDGVRVTNRIVLEPAVVDALLLYLCPVQPSDDPKVAPESQ